MGNVIITNKIKASSSTAITMRSNSARYPKKNALIYTNLGRRARSTDVTGSTWLFKLHLGSAKTKLEGIMLNDVNFSKIRIEASTVDSWASPSYATTKAVFLDSFVNRYKVYIPVNVNHMYIRGYIPAGASVVGSVTTAWSISSIVLLTSAPRLAQNIAYGYTRRATKPYRDITLSYGGIRRVSLSSNLRWEADVPLGARASTDETELWTINAMDNAKPFVFYEGSSSSGIATSKAYLCLRSADYQGEWISKKNVRGNIIRFEELV